MPSDKASLASRTPASDYVCPGCASPLIQPMAWERIGAGEWQLLVRCPECFAQGSLYLDDIRARQFQNLLDEATREIEEYADYLDRQSFKESMDSFVQALRKDLICPMDF